VNLRDGHEEDSGAWISVKIHKNTFARLSIPNTPQHFLIATILNTKSSRWALLAWLSIQVPIKVTVTAHGAQRSTSAKALQNVTLLTALTTTTASKTSRISPRPKHFPFEKRRS
jgi:hypothetical protein